MTCIRAITKPTFNVLRTQTIEEKLEVNPYDSTTDEEEEYCSRDDNRFLKTMKENIHVNENGNLECPLPFKFDDSKYKLPDNREEVYRRTYKTLSNIKNRPSTLQDSQKFMQQFIDKGHCEQVPADELIVKPRWSIPVFPVYHPKKKKIRLVFDSPASFHGSPLTTAYFKDPT